LTSDGEGVYTMPIYFYTPEGPYGCFSNFSRHGVELDGWYWPTVEHYFQAQKFTDAAQRERIARAHAPKQAKSLGWNRSIPIRADWEQIKEDVKRRAVLKKFETHTAIGEILLSTGDEELVENAPSDDY
jgi:N-glycosidase YbiA